MRPLKGWKDARDFMPAEWRKKAAEPGPEKKRRRMTRKRRERAVAQIRAIFGVGG
jgi:hypothetical protein